MKKVLIVLAVVVAFHLSFELPVMYRAYKAGFDPFSFPSHLK